LIPQENTLTVNLGFTNMFCCRQSTLQSEVHQSNDNGYMTKQIATSVPRPLNIHT